MQGLREKRPPQAGCEPFISSNRADKIALHVTRAVGEAAQTGSPGQPPGKLPQMVLHVPETTFSLQLLVAIITGFAPYSGAIY